MIYEDSEGNSGRNEILNQEKSEEKFTQNKNSDSNGQLKLNEEEAESNIDQ